MFKKLLKLGQMYYIGNHTVKRVVYFLNHINQRVD